jgi:hypothetical protein
VPAPTIEPLQPPRGLKRCEAAPLDYPDHPAVPRPPSVPFRTLPPDPVFAALGVPLVTFRSEQLVFHVSPDLPQPLVDCMVAAAEDAVAFVSATLGLATWPDGGPPRDAFVLSPESAHDALERLDPGRAFAVGPETGRTFVGSPRAHPHEPAIVAWKRLPVSYLEIGFSFAHEWTHMIQTHLRGSSPKEMDAVVEGEANLLAVMFQDAALPGAGSLFWDLDARRLLDLRSEHPDLGLHDLLTQRPHRYHEELTLFATMARSVSPADLGRVRIRARSERLAYDAAWAQVVGRPLVDGSVEAVVRDPSLAPRPLLPARAPSLTVTRSEDVLWFVASGFRPRERVTRSVRLHDGRVDTDALQADARGVVAWKWRLREGARYVRRDLALRGESGGCSGVYEDRD